MAGKNENDSTETSAVLQKLNKMCDTYTTTILLINHLSKSACVPEVAKDGLEMHHVRGSSAIAAFVRNIVGLDIPKGQVHDNEVRRVSIVKCNVLKKQKNHYLRYFQMTQEGLEWCDAPAMRGITNAHYSDAPAIIDDKSGQTSVNPLLESEDVICEQLNIIFATTDTVPSTTICKHFNLKNVNQRDWKTKILPVLRSLNYTQKSHSLYSSPAWSKPDGNA